MSTAPNIEPAGRKYGAILVDPPWRFITYSGGQAPHRSKEKPYDTMALDEIKALPVADMAADDCCLFMWVLGSMLPHALEVMDAWGFTFKTDAFHWAKPSIGYGHWTRNQVETVLMGAIGQPVRHSKAVRQLIADDRRQHSRKPDCIYTRIEQLVGGPYVELFARQQVPGWHCWGNETGKFGWPGVQGDLMDLTGGELWGDSLDHIEHDAVLRWPVK